jgi:hypothetical protein
VKPEPPGYRLETDSFQPRSDPELDEGPRDPVERLRCTGPDGVTQLPADAVASDHDFYGVEQGPWVSYDPPQFLVGHLAPGLADLVPSWRLYRACEQDPIAELSAHALGPAGVWAYAVDSGGWRVMLDGKEVGVVPDNLYGLTFAPPRP